MVDLPFSLGYKLQLGWRAQHERGELPRLRPALPNGPGATAGSEQGELLDLLRGQGFSYVEFSVGSCGSPGERRRLRREARACGERGLGVCLHPYLGGMDNPAMFGIRPESLAAVQSVVAACCLAAEATERPVGLVLHPAELQHRAGRDDVAVLRGQLLRRSREFFAALADCVADCDADVRPYVEHQVPPAPDERVIRVGDTYEELLRVVDGIGLELCWDTGHYVLSVLRHGQCGRPPEEFLCRVGYVHLHDVVEGRDHCVISPGASAPRDYVRTLLERGFAGGVTLEYSAEAMRDEGSFERVVARSLAALADWTG